MAQELTIAALRNAPRNQRYSKNLTLHSDRGLQCTSAGYAEMASHFSITLSFSAKGCPYDNATMEAFHSVLKEEEVYQTSYDNFEQAKSRFFEYIEGFYNRSRIHSAIGYLSPIAYKNLILGNL